MPVMVTSAAFSTCHTSVACSDGRISGGVAANRMIRGNCSGVTCTVTVLFTSPNRFRAVIV